MSSHPEPSNDIRFIDIISSLSNHRNKIILIPILIAIAGFIGSYFIPTYYTYSTSISAVSIPEFKINDDEGKYIEFSIPQHMEHLHNIVNSKAFINLVLENANINDDVHLTTFFPKDSYFLSTSATSKNKDQAMNILMAYLEEIRKIMLNENQSNILALKAEQEALKKKMEVTRTTVKQLQAKKVSLENNVKIFEQKRQDMLKNNLTYIEENPSLSLYLISETNVYMEKIISLEKELHFLAESLENDLLLLKKVSSFTEKPAFFSMNISPRLVSQFKKPSRNLVVSTSFFIPLVFLIIYAVIFDTIRANKR